MKQNPSTSYWIAAVVAMLVCPSLWYLVATQPPQPPSSYPDGYASESWEQVKAEIATGKVASVMQDHSRHIDVKLKDGSMISAVEPEIDAVIHEIQKHGEADIVRIATE